MKPGFDFIKYMEELLSYFDFSLEQIVILAVFFFITCIQLFYYLYYYDKPVSYYRKNTNLKQSSGDKLPSVSVIVLSRNESENLRKNLPALLNQNYHDFEVIVVNDGSTDESNDLLQEFSLKYPNLYHTFIQEPSDRALPRQMLSMTIGIKAAKKDMLLFIDPDCCPSSKKWIATMMQNVNESTKVVIGYLFYEKASGFFRRIARFDNLLFSLRYLSLAILKKGYIGVFQNIAFRKDLFFETHGLSSCLNYAEGDTVYLNRIIRSYEYQIAMDPESFVSLPLDDFSRWSSIKRTYMRAKHFFKGRKSSSFKIEAISRYLFFLSAVGILSLSIIFEEWGGVAIIAILFLIRQITQYVILKKNCEHFKTNRFLFSLPLLDLLQPIYNIYFTLTSRIRRR